MRCERGGGEEEEEEEGRGAAKASRKEKQKKRPAASPSSTERKSPRSKRICIDLSAHSFAPNFIPFEGALLRLQGSLWATRSVWGSGEMDWRDRGREDVFDFLGGTVFE